MSDKRSSILIRFAVVYGFILLLFVAVIYKIAVLQFIEKEQLLKMEERNTRANIKSKPNRGNIFACDGRLMASSIPTYYIYMDTRVPALRKDTNKLFNDNVDSLALCLSNYFGNKTKAEYLNILRKGFNEKKGELQLFPHRISYSQLKDIRKMPLFKMGRNKSGLLTKELLRREKPFGSLASRTLGDIYADESKGGKNGLELYYDRELLGVQGLSSRQKVANQFVETIQIEPIDGMDIMTTIDIDLQDIAEKALVDSIRSYHAEDGYAVLMEVATGEVKAIVNMQINADGSYSENKNGVVADLLEPGSTFKTLSLIALIDDGKAKITDTINTGNGIKYYAGRAMRDHNAHKGGYHTITLGQALHASSNVGISAAVYKAYGHNPSEFVDKLYKMGLNEDMKIEIPGSSGPLVRHPKDKSRYWSKTTLPWMSIGYESQVPPIYMLAYYNAIANHGKLIRPHFVTSIMQNGRIVKSFGTETIRESICKPSTLKIVHEALLGVVEGKLGTGHAVKSKYVRIAGKSGTAQISKGGKGYKDGGVNYLVSFCGYFPADNPLYTCIVVIRNPKKGYASGGTMSGSVFKSIAEHTMALKSNLKPENMVLDSTLVFPYFPVGKSGNYNALETAMINLNLKWEGQSSDWVKTQNENETMNIEPLTLNRDLVPDLIGMGAKDAMFLSGQSGLKVQLIGKGKVVSQNPSPGKPYQRGEIIRLNLEL